MALFSYTLKTFQALLILTAMIWVLGFVWFIWQTQKSPTDTSTVTDAIVVLTGGQNRIEVGYQLLQKNLAHDLFISGVSKALDAQRLSHTYNAHPTLQSRTYVGYKAENTKQNAAETILWLKSKEYQSIRLVTAGYHMPRSLLEFQRFDHQLKIIPHPIIPDNLHQQHLWHFHVIHLLFKEYIKFIVVALYHTKVSS